MKFKRRLSIAVFGLTVALTFAWGLAFMTLAYRQREPVKEPSTIHREPLHREPSTVNGAFVASVIKKKYHRPECMYVRQMEAKHQQTFASEQEAQAAGYEPCSKCLNSSARSTPPPGQLPSRR